jgi:hypothetical protein
MDRCALKKEDPMRRKFLFISIACTVAALFLAGSVLAAPPPNKRICVEVVLQEVVQEQEKPKEEKATEENAEGKTPEKKKTKKYPWERYKPSPSLHHVAAAGVGSYLPIGQTPVVYLKRLFEHFITHEKGYEAVQEKCDERIRVELYPLAEGWTAFARYTQNGREERADQLFAHEISQFAERAVHALLRDVPISDTIKRDNVLKSDSMKSVQRIKGTNHFVIGLGTQIRGGNFATAGELPADTAREKIRVFTPMTIATGYRGKFENWGIEAMIQVGIGTSRTAASENTNGGHVDFVWSTGLILHFLHYISPRGITSAYLGAGADFELLGFAAVKADQKDRSTLLGGGLDVDLIFGWEFMRASAVQFYLQAELNLPAYVLDNEDEHGGIHTWFPTASVKLGVIF